MTAPARAAAFKVIDRVFEHGAYADRALHGEASGLDTRDRGLAMRLAYGTIQRRDTLDWVIAGHARGKLEPRVRNALRLGLYQLLFTEVADHAAIAEAVELAKPSPGHRLVNAVLRTVQRQGVELPDDGDPAGAAIAHSHPRWMVDLWWDWLGAGETRALLAADNEPAENALRVNPLVGGTEVPGTEVPGTATDPELPEARVVDGPFDAFGSPLFQRGAFLPQSRASMMVAHEVDPQPGERVLDLCAAPGGKTTHLAALMGDRGEVVAVEQRPARARQLEELAQRMGATCVRVVVGDATTPPVDGPFDRILLDPPCSGLGTLQAHPDLRWRASPEAIGELAAQQERMLAAAQSLLAAGGRLVYSVCTLSPREEVLASERSRRTFPHRDGTEGFYIARHGV
jgi:16S rRNA (cytosine967-C5)-methyltransferase